MNKFDHLSRKEVADWTEKTDDCKDHLLDILEEMAAKFGGAHFPRGIMKNVLDELMVSTFNRALDERFIQRVIDEKVQDENKVKIGSNEYTLKKLPDGKTWMMESLREEAERAFWNERYNCYMYSFDEAQKAVPEGFHLPSPKEFMELALALGYLEKDGTVVADRFIKECNFTLSGHATDTGILCNQGINGLYWTSEQGSETFGYSLNLESSSVKPDTNFPKYNGLAVRCIKD